MGSGYGLVDLVELRSEIQTRKMRLRVPLSYRSNLDDVTNMLGYLLSNLQSHPLNRTSMYKAELSYSTKRAQTSMRGGQFADGFSISNGSLSVNSVRRFDEHRSDGKTPASLEFIKSKKMGFGIKC